MAEEKALGTFERYLALWVFLCMLGGLLLSQLTPGISQTINSWQIKGVSIPIGICLFLMMYPALLNVQLKGLQKLMKAPKPIFITLFSNWIIAPAVTAYLAFLFLKGHDQLIIAVILLGSSPCTAMVLVWGMLAKGNQEQNVLITTINTITILFLYAPLVAILTGIQDIPIDRLALAISVLVFIGVPLIAGFISKRTLIAKKGNDWFENTYKPIVGKIAMLALLTTLVVLFSLNGDSLIHNPKMMLLISIPMLLGFFVIVGINLLITKWFKLKYKEAIVTVIIGSSSHFEIAIATAVGLYGVGSMAALGTTMGLFWEVPIMLGLVYFGRWLGRKKYWA